MAVMYPPDPPPRANWPERRVRRAFETLSDDWIVFHQVLWQGERNGKPDDGEADFVLLNRNHGMLVVEVKGGGIRSEGTRLSSVDHNGEEHPIYPFEQAVSSKKALVRYVKRRGVSTLNAGHVVVFADIDTLPELGPASPDVTWTKNDLKDVAAAVDRAVRHWDLSARIPREFVERIVALLAPTVFARPLFRQTLEDAHDELFRLTQEQIEVMAGLRSNRRLVVFGRAGTGKTVLAMEEAIRLREEGLLVLLTCYNRPLADVLTNAVPAGDSSGEITVNTFHGLCLAAARDAGLPVPTEKTQEWWDAEAAALLHSALEITGRRFDAIIVDEGQDFDPSWWIPLQLALTDPDDGWMYVFADSQQAIYRQEGWEPPFEQPRYDLSINCRNTLPIARRVSSVFADRCATLGAGGSEPRFHPAETASEVFEVTIRVLAEWLSSQDLTDEQMVVLATNRDMVERLRGETVDGHQLVAPGGRGVVVETIARFKGLEADVVLLAFSTYSNGLGESLAYIGMSRARAHLEIISPSSLAKRLGWNLS